MKNRNYCKGLLPQDSLEHLEFLTQRARRLNKLASDILLVSNTAKLSSALCQFSLQDVVESIKTKHDFADKFSYRSKTQKITLPFEPVEAVLTQLMSNAIKHNDKGENLNATINCEEDNGNYTLIVEDNGPGIPKEFHQYVFDAFSTLKPKDTTEGSGVGLTIVKQIVERFRGSVTIDSDGRLGTRIEVRWPKSLKATH